MQPRTSTPNPPATSVKYSVAGEDTVKDAGKAQVATAPESHQADAGDPQRAITPNNSGDALLMLGTGAGIQVVRVSKIAMTLASPVWKAMFKRH